MIFITQNKTKNEINLTSIFALGLLFSSQAQSDTIPSNWKMKGIFGLNGTQSSFVNWNAGGRNNISLLGYIDASANYKKDLISGTMI